MVTNNLTVIIEVVIIDDALGEGFSAVWCSATNTHLQLLDCAVIGAQFLAGVCFNVTLLIINLWHYWVCCIRSGVTRCTLIMVLYLYHMCQCRLHTVLWLHIGNNLADPIFNGVGQAFFKSRAKAFLLA